MLLLCYLAVAPCAASGCNTECYLSLQFCTCFPGYLDDEHLFATPQKPLELKDVHQTFADNFSLSDDESPKHSSQISPASVLPAHNDLPLQVGTLRACKWRLFSAPLMVLLDVMLCLCVSLHVLVHDLVLMTAQLHAHIHALLHALSS